MLRSSLVITVIFGLNTIAQLVAQIVTTRLMGASVEYDVFLAAMVMPGLCILIFASTLNDIGAPEYSRRQHEGWLTRYILLFGGVGIVLALAGIAFAPYLVPMLVGVEKSDLFISQTVHLTQILMMTLPVSAVASASSSYWYATRQIYRVPLVSLAGSIILTTLTVLTVRSWSSMGLVVSTVTTGVISAMLLIPYHRLSWSARDHGFDIRDIVVRWLPLTLGTFAMRSDSVILRSLTSSLPDGHYVYINIVYKVIASAAGLLSIGIQISLLSTLLTHIQAGHLDEARRLTRRAKLLSVVSLLTMSVGILILGPYVIQTLYTGGRFTALDAKRAADAIPYFLPVLMGMGMFPVWIQPLLAIRKQLTVGIIGVTGFGLAMVVGSLVRSGSTLAQISIVLAGMYLFFIIVSEYLWQTYRS